MRVSRYVSGTMRTKLFALVAVVALFGAVVGPGVAAAADEAGNTGTEAGNTGLAVDVTQSEDDVTASVTENGSGVDNATVEVGGENGSTYDGIGEYTTDDDGEVDLPTPEVNETISVTATADNETATAMADLVAAEYAANDSENETGENATRSDAFGLQVSSFVQSLLGSNESAIGPQVAAFVTQNNPGNAPAHAGPPTHAGPGNDDKRGPPAHAGPGGDDADDNETDDDKRGPPAHAGPDGEDADENESDDDRRGPPEDAGPPAHAGPDGDDDSDDANETDDEETDDDTETEEQEETEDDAETEDDDSDEEETEDDEATETEAEDDEETETEADDEDEAEDDSSGPPEHANAGGD